MDYTRKMVLSPYVDEDMDTDYPASTKSRSFTASTTLSSKPETKPKSRLTAVKQNRTDQIMKKLVEVNGYSDTTLQIRDIDGNFIRNTDVEALVGYALKPNRNPKGLEEFVDLLCEARVNPDLIINQHIREKLLRLNTMHNIKRTLITPVSTGAYRPPPRSGYSAPPPSQTSAKSASRKRKMETNKSNQRWFIPSTDL